MGRRPTVKVRVECEGEESYVQVYVGRSLVCESYACALTPLALLEAVLTKLGYQIKVEENWRREHAGGCL